MIFREFDSLVEGFHNEINVSRCRVYSHQADAKDLANRGPKASGNFYVESENYDKTRRQSFSCRNPLVHFDWRDWSRGNYFSMAVRETAFASTPKGTLIAITVANRCSGLSMKNSCFLWTMARWIRALTLACLRQQASSPSSARMARASRSPYTKFALIVWW